MGYASIPADLTGYSQFKKIDYTGNGTQNRAIAHGYGKKPTVYLLVALELVTAQKSFFCGIKFKQANAMSTITVTEMDSTNVYVGSASFYGNENGKDYSIVIYA